MQIRDLTSPSDPEPHPVLENPAYQRVGNGGVERRPCGPCAVSNDRDAETERLLEACDRMDERPESWESWYHPDGAAEHDHLLACDT